MPEASDLNSILPRLPPEAQAWINSLPPFWRAPIEHRLQVIGADNFVEHWQAIRAQQERLADFYKDRVEREFDPSEPTEMDPRGSLDPEYMEALKALGGW
jgi:hypothetical protein